MDTKFLITISLLVCISIAVTVLYVLFLTRDKSLKLNEVKTKNINDKAVTENKIADVSISTSKLQDGSITSEKIKDGEVKSSDLSNGSVTSEKIANDSILSKHIQNGTVEKEDLSINIQKLLGNETNILDTSKTVSITGLGGLDQIRDVVEIKKDIGYHLICLSNDGLIFILRRDRNAPITNIFVKTLTDGRCMVLNKEETKLMVATSDGKVIVYDIENFYETQTVTELTNTSVVNTTATNHIDCINYIKFDEKDYISLSMKNDSADNGFKLYRVNDSGSLTLISKISDITGATSFNSSSNAIFMNKKQDKVVIACVEDGTKNLQFYEMDVNLQVTKSATTYVSVLNNVLSSVKVEKQINPNFLLLKNSDVTARQMESLNINPDSLSTLTTNGAFTVDSVSNEINSVEYHVSNYFVISLSLSPSTLTPTINIYNHFTRERVSKIRIQESGNFSGVHVTEDDFIYFFDGGLSTNPNANIGIFNFKMNEIPLVTTDANEKPYYGSFNQLVTFDNLSRSVPILANDGRTVFIGENKVLGSSVPVYKNIKEFIDNHSIGTDMIRVVLLQDISEESLVLPDNVTIDGLNRYKLTFPEGSTFYWNDNPGHILIRNVIFDGEVAFTTTSVNTFTKNVYFENCDFLNGAATLKTFTMKGNHVILNNCYFNRYVFSLAADKINLNNCRIYGTVVTSNDFVLFDVPSSPSGLIYMTQNIIDFNVSQNNSLSARCFYISDQVARRIYSSGNSYALNVTLNGPYPSDVNMFEIYADTGTVPSLLKIENDGFFNSTTDLSVQSSSSVINVSSGLAHVVLVEDAVRESTFGAADVGTVNFDNSANYL